VGDTVFVNGRAVVHKGSAGKSIAFPDVCLCPPTPPAGPIPTPLPNTVQAMDLAGGASSVLTEGNPTGKQSSYFAKSTGNEVSRPTGGGVVTQAVQGKAYFQSYSADVMFEGEPVVRHLDLLTHNHTAQAPGNTPPVPWLSTQNLPAVPPPAVRTSPNDGPGFTLTLSTGTGQTAHDPLPVDISDAGSEPEATKLSGGKFDHKKPKGLIVARFRELRRAFWTKFTVTASEPVEVALLSRGFPDGTKATFEIRHVGHPDTTPPLASLSATIKDNKTRAAWKYEQPLGAAPTAALVFVAIVDGKRSHSPELRVVASSATEVRGVKQRLRMHGYDAGPPDASEGGPLEAALRKFQTDHAPLEITGKSDPKTLRVLVALSGGG
jgi:hypothetical protein